MPSQPKFRQSFEEQQAAQPNGVERFQDQGKQAAKQNDASGLNNQQNVGQWGEDRANAEQNTSDTNNRPVNQSGREGGDRGVEEIPMENDTPEQFPEKDGNQQLS